MIDYFKEYLKIHMHIEHTNLKDVCVLTPKRFEDERGFFAESFNQKVFNELLGHSDVNFVQDNHSFSKQGVLRGLHYQNPYAQGKLVRVVKGCIYDVAVDLRQQSNTFGHWFGIELSAQNAKQLWIPAGFAHGFLALTDADVLYKTTDYWHAGCDYTLNYDDAQLNIPWQSIAKAHGLNEFKPLLSVKDQQGQTFADVKFYA